MWKDSSLNQDDKLILADIDKSITYLMPLNIDMLMLIIISQ